MIIDELTLALQLQTLLFARLPSGRLVGEEIDPALRTEVVRMIIGALDQNRRATDAQQFRAMRWLENQLHEPDNP